MFVQRFTTTCRSGCGRPIGSFDRSFACRFHVVNPCCVSSFNSSTAISKEFKHRNRRKPCPCSALRSDNPLTITSRLPALWNAAIHRRFWTSKTRSPPNRNPTRQRGNPQLLAPIIARRVSEGRPGYRSFEESGDESPHSKRRPAALPNCQRARGGAKATECISVLNRDRNLKQTFWPPAG